MRTSLPTCVQSVSSRAESEMTGKDAGVAVRERLCRTGRVPWGVHAGVEAEEMAAAAERLKLTACKDILRRGRVSLRSLILQQRLLSSARQRDPSMVEVEKEKFFKLTSGAA